jgi:hypothetical protein
MRNLGDNEGAKKGYLKALEIREESLRRRSCGICKKRVYNS